jgi:hypothetical protein
VTTRSLFWPRCRAQLEVVFDGRGARNSIPYHIEVDPHSASVGLNGFYEADTWDLEFDAKLLPFDPDQIAYCAVRIYLWDSQKNLQGQEWATDENLMVKGLLDDGQVMLVGEESRIKFTGRDYTALLADAEWDPKQKVPSGRPLDETVQEIADLAAPPGTRARFAVEWRGEDEPPICGGLHRSTKKKGLWVKPGKSYWDVIWDLCIQHAYVVHIEGSLIVIDEPVTQTKQTLRDAPRLVYGKHLTSLEIRRKFARETVPQIVIVSYDPKTGKRVETKFPEKRNSEYKVSAQREEGTPRDALGIPLVAKKDEQMFFPPPEGVVDPKALKRYARMRFYHLGRGETTYTMETSHLWIPSYLSPVIRADAVSGGTTSVQGYASDVNLLRLRPGNAIGIAFDPFNESVLRGIKDVGKRTEYIVSLGYAQKMAAFISANFERMELFKQNYYYNRGQIDYSVDDGVEIKIEAVNFAGEVQAIQFAETSADVDAITSA